MKRTQREGYGVFRTDLKEHPAYLQCYVSFRLVERDLLRIASRERTEPNPMSMPEGWPSEEAVRHYPVSRELASKTALCCFGLLPAEVYADALQEEVPEAEWAAELLREWARVERENGT